MFEIVYLNIKLHWKKNLKTKNTGVIPCIRRISQKMVEYKLLYA